MIVSRLPPQVDLLPGAVLYRHDSRLAVRMLAEQLRECPAISAVTIAAVIVDKGIMYPRQWWARLCAWIATKRGMSRYDFWNTLCTRHPALAYAIIEQTADHIVNGKDREQPGSVGGLSQREINCIANMLAVATGAFNAEMEAAAAQNQAGTTH